MNTLAANTEEASVQSTALTRKNIVFLDYDLNNYHANTFRNLLKNELADTGFSVGGCHALNSSSGRAWAADSEIPYIEDLASLQGTVEGVAVLAPSNPEAHVALVQKACLLKAPIYVDKTIAMTVDEVDQIFRMADSAGVPIFSSSALRFADELQPFREWNLSGALQQMQVYAGGASSVEYLIHPLETLISTMGTEIREFDRRMTGLLGQIRMIYQDGRIGTVFMYPKSQSGFRVVAATADKTIHTEIVSPIFKNLLTQMLAFFSTGREPVQRAETRVIVETLQKSLLS